MFNTDIDTFGNDTVSKNDSIEVNEFDELNIPNTFVNDNTNGMSSYVENTTGFTVIKSVWHTFLHSTITLLLKNKSKVCQLISECSVL